MPTDSPNRRQFLQTSLAASAAAAVASDPSRRSEAAEAGPAGVAPSVAAFELDELGIAELAEGMRSGKYTSVSLTQKYVERIEAIDRNGPRLRSVIELNPDAAAVAEALDKERKEKGPRGPLHGIPVLIKDNIDTFDKMATTAGSLAMIGSKPLKDSGVAARLRAGGAVILGKTNLSEWANIRSSRSTSGWSGRGGLTRHPYSLDRNPSGSSSGSAVAAAANLCSVAVGTETDGSIVSPASACGIVGLKPTVGLVSRAGIIPISHTQDTAGPMTRTVRDAAILLSVIAGADPDDEATRGAKAEADYTKFLDAAGLKGARIGVVRRLYGFHACVAPALEQVLETLRKHGAEVVDQVDHAGFGSFGPAEMTVFMYELKHDLAAYFARLGPGAPMKSLKDVIEFNDRNRDREMPFFGQEHFLTSQEKGPLTDKDYLDALETCRRLSRAEGIDKVMDKHKLDALVAPTTGPASASDLLYGCKGGGGSSSAAAVAGYPSITLPAAFAYGLPMGVSFFGRAWSEPTLLKIAYAFEQATKVRKAPRFLSTPEFG